MLYLGIDPGKSGAVAVLSTKDSGEILHVSVHDTPTMKVIKNGKKRDEYLIRQMVDILERFIPYDHVVIEKVNAMPGQGVTSMFSFGRGLGLWEGILTTLDIPYTMVAPVTWKKKMLSDMDKSSKDSSRLRALQLFPQLSEYLKRKKDDGRAEALLMSEYARRYCS